MTAQADQLTLDLGDGGTDDPRFLTEQLITYIGNKRALIKPIASAVVDVRKREGRRLRVLDAFSGSGVVARMLKAHASTLVVNDLEAYATMLSRCYLVNRDEVPWEKLRALVEHFNALVDHEPTSGGFIERLYAPEDDNDIQPGERVFYTRDNARRLDQYAQLIHAADEDLKPFLLGPLLSAASIHANTAGVFKGFYKDRHTGIGRFGGAGEDALSRIKGQIRLRTPVLSDFSSVLDVHQRHANDLVRELQRVDLAYFDPPYNQHPYGSNYFMLNLLVNYDEPTEVSQVSGIPCDWQRSEYNVKRRSVELMQDLIQNTDAKYLLISFNDEGFIPPDAMQSMLSEVGKVSEFQTVYNAFRGSRNLRERKIHVTEHLYLVDRT